MNIHITAIKRLILGWLTVSALIGGGAYWFGLWQMSQQVATMAKTEVVKVAPEVLKRVNGSPADIRALQAKANDYQTQGFIVVEIYNRAGEMVVQRRSPEATRIEQALDALGPHHLPRGKGIQTERMSLAHNEIIRVLVPLQNGSQVEGHFEGIYLVPADKMQALRQETRRLLAAVFIVVLFTTLLLYPFILSLNRKVHAEAHAILHSNLDLMEVLGSAIAKRDSDTNSHNYRVTIYAVRLAEALGLRKNQIKELIAGAFLHDVGKIGIQDAILLKPDKLTEEEFSIMKQHVPLGLEIISHSAWLHHARDVVGCHHEWFDGSGYPKGLAGTTIPLTARIFAIADVFDAMTSRRPYKEPWSLQTALDTLGRGAGTHFDPTLLTQFLRLAPDLHTRINQVSGHELRRDLRALVEHYWNGRSRETAESFTAKP